jgi:hypothetical protein
MPPKKYKDTKEPTKFEKANPKKYVESKKEPTKFEKPNPKRYRSPAPPKKAVKKRKMEDRGEETLVAMDRTFREAGMTPNTSRRMVVEAIDQIEEDTGIPVRSKKQHKSGEPYDTPTYKSHVSRALGKVTTKATKGKLKF